MPRVLCRVLPLVLLSVACAEPPVGPHGPATLTIHLTDGPGDIKAAVVTIAQVYLQGTGGRTVLGNTPYTVDLISLATTSTVLLEDVQVAAGTYSELRFVVTGAYIAVEDANGGTRIFASAPDYAGLPQGAVVNGELQLPSFATSGLKVRLPDGGLKVPTSGVVSLLVDFDVGQSYGQQAGNSGMWEMHPVVTATDVTQGTTLMVTLALGTGVTLPAGVTLGDFRATLAAASAPDQVLAMAAFNANGSGTYRAALGFVAPGTYLVNLVVPVTVGGVTVSPAVPVAFTAVAGPSTTLELTVTGTSASGFVLASVTAGTLYTCGLTSAGAAYCWGNNDVGQLGEGTPGSRLTPTAVAVPAGFAFKSVIAGSVHTCGVTSADAAYCWGDNSFGELGDGTSSARLTPAAVAMPTGVTFASVAIGGFHTCGLTPGGTAYCWGTNGAGELGDGTTSPHLTPMAVTMPPGVTFAGVTAGHNHTCGLTPAGAAYCWGANNSGQLGDGTMSSRLTPTAVAMPSGVSFVSMTAGNFHTCGLTPPGAAYCWGDNSAGELGDGTNSVRLTPAAVAMPAGATFAGVTAGHSHTCGLTPAEAAYCWGNNPFGQLGDGTTSNRQTPVAVAMPAGVSFARMTGGFLHTCGLTPAGVAYCWGANNSGQLGDGTTVNRLTPAAVALP